MSKEIELLLLYKRAKNLIKSLHTWQILLYDNSSKGLYSPDDYWENVEWKETIENELNEAKKLISRYNSLRTNDLPWISCPSFKISRLDSIDRIFSIIGEVTRTLEDVHNVLSIYIEPQLSEKEKQKIDSLRNELEEMENKGYDELMVKNLREAVKEMENNHYLASSIIAARVILYCIDQIEGKSEEEKAQLLVKLGVIPKGEKSKETTKWFIKAIKAARNSVSHKITVFPSASEAFSILGDSFKMVKILNQYAKTKTSKGGA